MSKTNFTKENLQKESDSELSGAEFLKQLEKKREDSKKDWNRYVFAVRTNDDIASVIKDYCHLNNISKNHFFKNLLKDFFNYE